MDLSKLKELIDLMNRHELEELEIEIDGFKTKLKKKGDHPVMALPAAGMAMATGGHAAAPAGEGAAAPVDESKVIRSPLVGTYYHAPSPDAEPFVEVGDRVEEGKVLCIVEAMKVMNEIKADREGVIEEIYVENGEAVEYNGLLFRIG